MRPRFVLEVKCDAGLVMDLLREGAERHDQGLDGRFSERHGVVMIAEHEREFWSTQLGITVEDTQVDASGAQRPTHVLGVFSPHPEIWTAYVFAIGTLTTIGIFGLMYGIAQLSMGHAPWGMLVSTIAVLVGGLLYTSTLVGQSLALGEMYLLRSYVDDCLDEAQARALRDARTAPESAQL